MHTPTPPVPGPQPDPAPEPDPVPDPSKDPDPETDDDTAQVTREHVKKGAILIGSLA